jgi:hypothetical protein
MPDRREVTLYASRDVDVLEYPPHMAGYFTLYGLRVRTANGRAHVTTLTTAELRELRRALNRLEL